MKTHFRYTNVPKIPVYVGKPKTAIAEKFAAKYGEVFNVQEAYEEDGCKVVAFKTGYDKEVIVKMKSDGIYVNDKFFAKSWDEE